MAQATPGNRRRYFSSMVVTTDLSQRRPEPAVLTIGNFDGVHLGHQQLIGAVKQRARELGVPAALLTFEPHTRRVVSPDRSLVLLTPLASKLEALAQTGLDEVVVVDFDREKMGWDARRFLSWVRETLPFVELWVGEGFALGHHRTGSTAVLRELGTELGFRLVIFKPVEFNGLVVSSTAVREALGVGDVRWAASLLGRPFTLIGTVVSGEKRGRELGFPTANLQCADFQALPADGIYATLTTRLSTGETLKSLTSVGTRPTFGPGERLVEGYILDFNSYIYGEQLEVAFIEFLRPQETYNGVEPLIAQMNRDVANARAILDQRELARP